MGGGGDQSGDLAEGVGALAGLLEEGRWWWGERREGEGVDGVRGGFLHSIGRRYWVV